MGGEIVKKLKLGILILVGLLLLIQLFPATRSNPKVSGDIQTTAGFKRLLRRSCYDCHSYDTRWPWYSHVAPVSWLVVHDVEEARGRLNFSKWEEYSPAARGHLMEEIVDEVTDGDMPLPRYLYLHPKARISQTELELFKQWVATVDDQHRQD